MVRFKTDPSNPCTFRHYSPEETQAWQLVRGTAVKLIKPIPASRVINSELCGSDAYWLVAISPELRAAMNCVANDSTEQDHWVVCRHVLEMGD